MPYATNMGVKIHYQVEGTGPPLIMLHGLLGNIEIWKINGFVDKLKSNHQLILIDRRGFGLSDKPHDAADYSYQNNIEDVIAVLDAASVDQAHLYGHSLGGWYTYGIAYHYPTRIKSLIISDGVPGREDAKGLPNLGSYKENIPKSTLFSEEVKDQLLQNDLDAFAAFSDWSGKGVPEVIDFIQNAIKQLDLPTLLLVSNSPDDSDEIRLLKKTAESIRNARFIQFKDLAHLELSSKSDIVVPYILEFLASIPEKKIE